MFYFFRQGTAGLARRSIALLLAYVLLLQSVFVALVATEHALAASAQQFALICADHQDGTTPAKAPAPIVHYTHCAICIAAASSFGVLPDTVAVVANFLGRGEALSFTHFAADLPAPPSPKLAQGPPLTV
jgi:hypothetical protein